MSAPSSPTRPAYRICTERLIARCWSPGDAPRLREALDASDAHLRPWIPFMKDEPRSLAETVQQCREHRAKFDRDEAYRYGLWTSDEQSLIGEGMLIPRVGPGGLEIGYWIDVRQAGNGYGTEITSALVRVAFEVHGVERVEIHCAPENGPSAAIPEKLRFRLEATLGQRFTSAEGRTHALMIWTLFADGFEASPAKSAAMRAYDAAGEPL